MTTSPLVLGPMMRYVDETSASIWVETRGGSHVTVRAGHQSWAARTFAVHGHHYALVEAAGLEPGTVLPYTLEIDGAQCWPEPSSEFPPPVIAALKPGKPLRMAYGSCRTSVPHDESGNRTHGVDSLRAFALSTLIGMAPGTIILNYFGKSFFTGGILLQILLGLLLVILLFVIPVWIRRKNPWGWYDKMTGGGKMR